MHASKLNWSGKAFALSTSNDTGGKKSRIRRSKEERKSMIESFIIKYQRSNGGNFPSLNLTHKEVGGSFYTVREIVREIIQENRVLAPPKVSVEEESLSGFLEEHPLGSISMQSVIDLSVSDRDGVVTHTVPEKIQLSAENISSSSESTELVPDSPQSRSGKFEENILNGFEVVPLSDKPLITSADHQTVDKAKEFAERIYTEPTANQEKLEAQHVDTSPAIKSHTNSDIEVETFPLRPVPRTVNSGKQQEAAETLEEKGDKELPHENRKHPSEVEKVPLLDRAKASSCTEALISEDSASVGEKPSDGDTNNVGKANNPTLHRINLQTWERTAKKSTPPESNPLLAFVKTIISSFVKLWME